MDEYITQLGVGGIFAIVVIREVLTFAKSKSSQEIYHRLGGIETNVASIKTDVRNIKDRVGRMEGKVFNGG